MKKKNRKKEVNWYQIIALSAAGQYIQNRLNEELKNLEPVIKSKKK